MFRKLLKYDFRALTKLWLLLSATALGLAVVGGVCLRGLVLAVSEPAKIAFMPFCMMGFMLSMFGLAAYVIAITVIIMIRFYSNLFTDQGYLTFTLPVKRSAIFNSKLLTAFVFNTSTLLVFLASVIIVLAIAPGGQTANSALGEVVNGLRISLISMGAIMTHELAAWITVYIIVFVLLCVVQFVYSTLLLFACVTFGSIIVKKLKVLMAIGLYYGASMVTSVVSYILSALLSVTMMAIESAPAAITAGEALWAILLVIIGVILAIGLVCCFLYKFTVEKLRGNLNLA